MQYRFPGGYREHVRTKLRAAFAEAYTPHETGVSFAVGLFLLALPNFGASILLLGALGRRYAWINRLAFVAAIAILNPLAKGSVYVLSYLLGRSLLGPVAGISLADVSLAAGPAVLSRLLLGNVLLAVAFAAAGYGLARYGVRATRRYRT